VHETLSPDVVTEKCGTARVSTMMINYGSINLTKTYIKSQQSTCKVTSTKIQKIQKTAGKNYSHTGSLLPSNCTPVAVSCVQKKYIVWSAVRRPNESYLVNLVKYVTRWIVGSLWWLVRTPLPVIRMCKAPPGTGVGHTYLLTYQLGNDSWLV